MNYTKEQIEEFKTKAEKYDKLEEQYDEVAYRNYNEETDEFDEDEEPDAAEFAEILVNHFEKWYGLCFLFYLRLAFYSTISLNLEYLKALKPNRFNAAQLILLWNGKH